MGKEGRDGGRGGGGGGDRGIGREGELTIFDVTQNSFT